VYPDHLQEWAVNWEMRYQILFLCLYGAVLAVLVGGHTELVIYTDSGELRTGQSAEGAEASLIGAYVRISERYDLQFPPQYLQRNLQPHHHNKRCTALEPGIVSKGLLSGTYAQESGDKLIMVQSSCLADDSFGNKLGHYFEVLSCATQSGANFASVAKVWNPKTQDAAPPFMQGLPDLLANHGANSENKAAILNYVRDNCRCPGGCHERSTALWTKNAPLIRKLMMRGVESHLKHYFPGQDPQSIRIAHLDSQEKVNKEIPLIPSVAVHYRCGDNFVGEYGFLPFSIVSNRILIQNKEPQFIYILAESRNRKTGGPKKQLAEKCDVVLTSLHSHLRIFFPKSTVVLLRGGDMYTDLVRLTLAPVVVCSVSTFCLWPAIANAHGEAVYFPKTRLVAAADTTLNLGFTWIQTNIVKGAPYLMQSTQMLLTKLQDKFI